MGAIEEFSLEGKVALITGATRGIGKAIAVGFRRAGAQLWLHDRTEAGATVAKELDAQYIAADFSRPDEVTRLIEHLTSRLTRLDVLVNNAGTETIMPIDRLQARVLDETWHVNARAPALLISGLLPLLKASGRASVINVTSIHSEIPYPQNVAYNMSKAALDMLTKTAAVELAPLGIRVNNLAPGVVATDINRHVLEKIGMQRFAEWVPAGRVGAGEDIVGPAIFLASEAAAYVSGTTLFADGAYRQNFVRFRPDNI
jgi:NAD(P)-dependent dehydrogenase (short-subunit alcohol dehydrogenase family)